MKYNYDLLDKDVLDRIKPSFYDPYSLINRLLRKAYEDSVPKILDDKKKYRIIDYGCGVRPYEYIFEPYIEKYIGVDVGENPKADILILPDEKLPFEDSSFDILLSSQVVEHVEEVEQYISESNRVLKKGGLIFLSTHGTWQYHSDPIDVQRWTSYGLKKWLNKNNFEVIGFLPVLGQLALTSQLRLSFFNSFANFAGPIGKILLFPISVIYQFKMIIEDFITPKRVKERDSAIFLAIGKKIND
jgi:SAM-dependent methyltransferase